MKTKNYWIHQKKSFRPDDIGNDIESDHFGELIGSLEFTAYRHHKQNINGLPTLIYYLEKVGFDVFRSSADGKLPKEEVETITISGRGQEIPTELLKKIHNWAHRRKLPHSFYKIR